LVYRAERCLWPARPRDRQDAGLGRAERARRYGITTTPDGGIYFASLANSYIARIDPATRSGDGDRAPTPRQGARRVWSDSTGKIWVSEWNSGNVSRYDPATSGWKTWKLPGDRPRTYAVYVDEKDIVWLTEWSANAVVRFDPASETFTSFRSPNDNADVRQLLAVRRGLGARIGADRLVVFRTK